jgi:inner membrane protein
MDNVCHTLVGAAMGEAGLKQRTRYGNATLMIAANLPDLDVLVFLTPLPSVAFRRGWTHGILAQLLLPVVLTAVVVLVDRWRRRPGNREGPPLSVPWLLALSYLGIYSHVFFDFLNSYGIRLLSPLDWRWFYGDAVFIIDIWLWAMLGAGVWLARRATAPAAARGALAFATCYVVAMLLAAGAARASVLDAWRSLRGTTPRALMVGPLPVTPFDKEVIVDAGAHYERGRFSWRSGALTLASGVVAKHDDAPEIVPASRDPGVRGFLVWSRFPYWQLEPVDGGTRVTVRDMRFGDRFSASAYVPLTSAGALRRGAAQAAQHAEIPLVERVESDRAGTSGRR